MNRRDFLTNIAKGVVAASVLPSVRLSVGPSKVLGCLVTQGESDSLIIMGQSHARPMMTIAQLDAAIEYVDREFLAFPHFDFGNGVEPVNFTVREVRPFHPYRIDP